MPQTKKPVKVKVDFKRRYIKIVEGCLWDAFQLGKSLIEKYGGDIWYYKEDDRCYEKPVEFTENESWDIVRKIREYVKA